MKQLTFIFLIGFAQIGFGQMAYTSACDGVPDSVCGAYVSNRTYSGRIGSNLMQIDYATGKNTLWSIYEAFYYQTEKEKVNCLNDLKEWIFSEERKLIKK